MAQPHPPPMASQSPYAQVGYGELNDQQRGTQQPPAGYYNNNNTTTGNYMTAPTSGGMNMKVVGGIIALLVLVGVVVVVVLLSSSSSPTPTPPPTEEVEDGVDTDTPSSTGNNVKPPAAVNGCKTTNGGCDAANGKCAWSTSAKAVTCSCVSGYTLQTDKKTCKANPDVDPLVGNACASSNGGCDATNGVCALAATAATGVKCTCKTGFSLDTDGVTCKTTPVTTANACATANGGCDATNGVCTLSATKTATCSCRTGFTLAADKLKCTKDVVTECTNTCSGHGKCVLTGTTQSCTCNTGFSGASCEKIDADPKPDPVSCTLPALPAASGLTKTVAKLPDPFTTYDGKPVTTKKEWTCRRQEIAAMLEKYELGPYNPKNMSTATATVSGNTITVTAGGGTFKVTATYPSTGTAPYPAMITLDGGSLPKNIITGLGIALLSFDTNNMAMTCTGRGTGVYFNANGKVDAGALIAWAWGVSRLIDALEVTPTAKIDTKHLGVTGCSRNGKGALVIGAFDERIALTIPQESGSGGAGSWRVSDDEFKTVKTQTLSEIVDECDWFSNTFATFKTTATKLPYDHHMLMGMVAPRGLFSIENTIDWLGVASCVVDVTAAREIYKAHSADRNMGFTQRSHDHCVWPTADDAGLKGFLQQFLLDKAGAAPSVWVITKNGPGGNSSPPNMTKWVDWKTPILT